MKIRPIPLTTTSASRSYVGEPTLVKSRSVQTGRLRKVGFTPALGRATQSLTKALGAMASGARFWNGLTTLVFAILGGICFALIYYYGDRQANELGLVDIHRVGFHALR